MNFRNCILTVFLLLSLSVARGEQYSFSEDYNKTDTISKNVTWTSKKSPYFLYNKLIIDTNATLTIEPGALVIFKDYSSTLEIRGKLIAEGVNFQPHYLAFKQHGDSLLFNDKYYSPAGHDSAKKAYNRVNYDTYFMPGLSYSFFQPKSSDSIGNFSGITVEYLIFGKVSQNDKPGPSHVRVYSKLSIMQSSQSSVKSMFMYALGLDLSLEKNPKRSYLVPYFGLEIGGLSQKKFGSCMIFTPTLGIHVLSEKNIFININGGYVYPMDNFESLQGWYAQAGINFAMW